MNDPHRDFFDNLASQWDLHYTAEDLERLSHLMAKLEITEGMSVLDLGCSTGILFDMLRRRVGATGMVTGVDYSLRMVEKAHRNFPFDNVTVVDADASNLPFLDSTYDLAISFESFPHFSKKQETLSEVDRVLKPGARIYIIDLASSKELVEIHQSGGGVIKDDELPSDAELRQMFAASNFEQVQIEDHPGLFLASAVNAK